MSDIIWEMEIILFQKIAFNWMSHIEKMVIQKNIKIQ